MIERMLTGGGVSIGESYEAKENGKTVTIRSIGPIFRQSNRDNHLARTYQPETSSEVVRDSQGAPQTVDDREM